MSCIGQVGFQWGVVRYHGFFAVSFLVNGVSTTSLQKLIGNDGGGGGGVVRGLVLGTIMISSLATSYKNGSESLIGMVE